MSPVSEMLDEDEARQFARFLKLKGIDFSDDIDAISLEDVDPFEAEVYLEEDNDEIELPHVGHWEVGWSWWSHLQTLMARTLGEAQTPTALHLHAWHGVAVPADMENAMLGEPTRRQPAPPPKQGFLGGLFGGKKTSHDAEVARQIEVMMAAYAGPYENLMVASGPRLLAEMDAAAAALGLDESEMGDRYEACGDEDDFVEVAKCYLLIARAFLREAVDRGHLCWWVK